MDSRHDENRWPSLEEFRGWYNLGYERPDGIPVLHSQERVPEFEHGEFFELYVNEHKWFEQLVPPSDLRPFDPLTDPPIFVKSDADDRTLDLEPNFEYLTLELIERIQKEFLGKYPLWRVVLAADDTSCGVVIYPQAVRFGNLPLGTDPLVALGDVVDRAVALRDQRLEPERAELAFIRQRLPDAITALGDQPFLVAGVLDNKKGDRDRLTLLLLIRASDDDAFRIGGPAGVDNDFLWSGRSFAIDATGTIINGEKRPEAVAFTVTLWYPRADYRGPLTIIDRENNIRGEYEVRTEKISRAVTGS